MIVCVCKGVSDRTIHRLAEAGHSTVRELGRVCAAGTDCGSCAPALRRLLERRQAASHHGSARATCAGPA